MRNFKNKLSIYILFFLTLYAKADIIKIPPIGIESKKQKSSDTTTSILSNLKRAVIKNQKSKKLSKEEEVKIILENLKKRVSTQTTNITEKKIKKPKKHIRKKIDTVKRKAKLKVVKKNIKKITVPIKQKQKVEIIKKNIKTKIIPTSTEPIGFVQTLGIVGKSEIYEVNNVTIDKREELRNDGVVDIPTATTDKLDNLPFVKPLEVIEVTEPFEASEAKKYQLNKR